MKKLIFLLALMMPAMISYAQTKNKKTVAAKTVKQVKAAKVEQEVVLPTPKKEIELQGSYLEIYNDGTSFEFKGTRENYLVINADGYSQKDLYNKMLLSLNNYYVDIDKVVTKIEYDALTINAKMLFDKAKRVTKNPYFFMDETCLVFTSIDYRLSFKFKDGKIRIDLPYIKSAVVGTIIPPDRNYTIQNSDMTQNAYNGISELFDNLLVSLLKGAYQSTDNDW